MKKTLAFLLLFFSSIVYLSALDIVITPVMGLTHYLSVVNYPLKGNGYTKPRKVRNFYAIYPGLELTLVDTDSYFTFFMNNHLSFLEDTKTKGDIDFITQKGASVVENMLWDFSLLLGYTLDFEDYFYMRFGIGMGMIYSNVALAEEYPMGLGTVANFVMDYFFIHSLGISVGVEEGVYGDVKRGTEESKGYNRFSIRFGLAIRF